MVTETITRCPDHFQTGIIEKATKKSFFNETVGARSYLNSGNNNFLDTDSSIV